MYVDSGAIRIRLPQTEIEQLGQENIGRDIVFGIRPEDIHHPQYVPAGVNQQSFEATVDVTELMGNEIFVYLIAGEDQDFIARVDPRSDLRSGEKVNIVFNADKVHIFDAATEKNIATPLIKK
jgi:multiple sugar transport system ATP-binding protein